jgi:dihydropyrimidine dehydrogenase (NAD+) subunit PreT
MTQAKSPGLCSERLSLAQYANHFADAHPPLNAIQAKIEAERCYYCYDAPCTIACPTGIDIPSFIAKIAQGNLRGAAKTILEENIMGGMCARVCPTEVLCEQACVRNTNEEKPVEIGLLQRHATDALMANPGQALFTRAKPTSKKIAVVGAGPAGLSCAHRLAMLGHEVEVFDKNAKPGGLNEYGLASYKTTDHFAQKEIEWLLSIGGITLRLNQALGQDFSLDSLSQQYDAVFLGIGLSGVNQLALHNGQVAGLQNAVDFIASLRQANHPKAVVVGSQVVVIGGGMTAVDAAVQAKKLGAQTITMVYRKGPDNMSASIEEQKWARLNDVNLQFYASPVRVLSEQGRVTAIEFAKSVVVQGQVTAATETLTLPADMVLTAVGQKLQVNDVKELELKDGKIKCDANGKTAYAKIWVGGDCRPGGQDLTVEAVQHGKLAAIDIDKALSA